MHFCCCFVRQKKIFCESFDVEDFLFELSRTLCLLFQSCRHTQRAVVLLTVVVLGVAFLVSPACTWLMITYSFVRGSRLGLRFCYVPYMSRLFWPFSVVERETEEICIPNWVRHISQAHPSINILIPQLLPVASCCCSHVNSCPKT